VGQARAHPCEHYPTLELGLPGQDIVVTGSITVCHTLIGAGLVDEYRVFVYPVVQGRRPSAVPDGFECPKLRLVEAEAFRSGITYSDTLVPDFGESRSRIVAGAARPSLAGVLKDAGG
jgi:dihydrofolate reductase